MLVVRTVKKDDLQGLMSLAIQVGDGMTTLKPDALALEQRIEIACASFSGTIAQDACDYLFVLEDCEKGMLAGVCAIRSVVGLREPFYNYRIGTLVHSSIELNIFSQMETLYLSNDLTGSAELCSLFLHPSYRNGINGKLLSKSRFVFMAQFPHLFPEKLIAEMRGFQKADGTSPFWDNLGKHFFQMDFNRADDLSSLGKKSFIAELMPRHPLYVAYLPLEAQEAIGKVHADTAPARHLLEQEGMRYDGYVDIFDAGPVLQARIRDLRATRENMMSRVQIRSSETITTHPENAQMIVSTTSIANFRALSLPLQRWTDDGSVALEKSEADLLNCENGDPVCCLALKVQNNGHTK